MKKFLLATLMLFGFSTVANSAGVNIGVTLNGGAFEVDGASEVFSGTHASNSSSTTVNKNADSDEAQGAFAYGSIFAEVRINDLISLGVDYVPTSLDSETTENVQIDTGATPSNSDDTSRTNTVAVSFEDLTTAYVMLNATENLYIKVGLMEVEAITKENLATGGSYGNATLEGVSAGFGYNGDLANDMFFRLEANYMDFDGAEKTNDNDSNKKIKVDGITGFGGKISVGRSF